jgi:hypothetical protein
MLMRVCGRAEMNIGSFHEFLGVVRGEDADEGKFFMLFIIK